MYSPAFVHLPLTASVLSSFAAATSVGKSSITTHYERQSMCESYTIINTRGTGEPQGPSSSFVPMNRNILAQRAGGKVYDTVYPASANQDYMPGTQDIIRHVKTTLETFPDECFIIQGYSQGATAVVEALRGLLDEPEFDAVKGVFLLGSGSHKPGLACNVDNFGGNSTFNAIGVVADWSNVAEQYISKTADVCIFADGICDSANGEGINEPHTRYFRDTPTQNLGTAFALSKLG